jgi:hypothetical protein
LLKESSQLVRRPIPADLPPALANFHDLAQNFLPLGHDLLHQALNRFSAKSAEEHTAGHTSTSAGFRHERPEQAPKDVAQRQAALPGLFARGSQNVQPALHEVCEQHLLGGKVIKKSSLGYIRRVRDVLDGGFGKAARPEKLDGSAEKAIADFDFVPLPSTLVRPASRRDARGMV